MTGCFLKSKPIACTITRNSFSSYPSKGSQCIFVAQQFIQMSMEMYIEHDFRNRSKKVFLYKKGNRSDTFYALRNGELIGTTVDNDYGYPGPIEPFLNLPSEFANDLIRLMVEHCTREGIHTEKESKLEGRLEATKAHLADMQAITKKLLKMA